MTGYLTVPMYFGAELVKITPMDFLRDTLLWPRLIDKYRGTMTAAPNFAYTLLAKRLRRQAAPGEFDLSCLRWALSGAEQVDPLDVEDLCTRARQKVEELGLGRCKTEQRHEVLVLELSEAAISALAADGPRAQLVRELECLGARFIALLVNCDRQPT